MVLVKICGITNFADAKAAFEAGANSLGLNFYPRSPRFIARADAAKIRIRLPGNVESVGVFVNASAADVAALYRDVRFTAAQLHGDESPETVKDCRSTRRPRRFCWMERRLVNLEAPVIPLTGKLRVKRRRRTALF